MEAFAIPDLPSSHGKEQTLAVTMKDAAKCVKVTLYYSTHTGSDVIVKSIAVTNEGQEEVKLLRVMSNQLDLARDDFILDTLDGAWGRERQINSEALRCGVTKTDSKRGISSNSHNPYVVLRSTDSNRFYGEASTVFAGTWGQTKRFIRQRRRCAIPIAVQTYCRRDITSSSTNISCLSSGRTASVLSS